MPYLRKITLTSMLLAALFVSSAAAIAGFDEGYDAYARGDFATAVREFTVAAEQGDYRAQVNLGVMYSTGEVVPLDIEMAVKWYLRAAVQGDVISQLYIGEKYRAGEVLPQDYEQAIVWFTRAAEQGNVLAQYSLGLLYAENFDMSNDHMLTFMWLFIASENGNNEARQNLSLLDSYMTSSAKTLARYEAVKWLEKYPN